MNSQEINVGIDNRSNQLDIFVRPTGQFFSVNNDSQSIKELVKQLQALRHARVYIDSTGQLELDFIIATHKAGLPVVICIPGQVRQFAKAAGRVAKTDKLDAHDIEQVIMLHVRIW